MVKVEVGWQRWRLLLVQQWVAAALGGPGGQADDAGELHVQRRCSRWPQRWVAVAGAKKKVFWVALLVLVAAVVRGVWAEAGELVVIMGR